MEKEGVLTGELKDTCSKAIDNKCKSLPDMTLSVL